MKLIFLALLVLLLLLIMRRRRGCNRCNSRRPCALCTCTNWDPLNAYR